MIPANGREVSAVDEKHYRLLRDNVTAFLDRCGRAMDRDGLLVLDIAPQVHAGAAPHFPRAAVETLDIDPAAGSTYVADICADNSHLVPDSRFDVVVCTEVLEHTLNPFAAVQELHRLTRPGGHLLLTVPFNFRIHGPLPDCWRFTEHGLRALLVAWELTELDALEDDDRFLMPIHYTVVARRAA